MCKLLCSLSCSSRLTGPLSTGAWAGPSYCALVTHPVGAWQTAHSLGFIAVPLVTSAATFAATSCALTNLRGKDDAWNPAFGGLAAGSIFGAASEWDSIKPAGVSLRRFLIVKNSPLHSDPIRSQMCPILEITCFRTPNSALYHFPQDPTLPKHPISGVTPICISCRLLQSQTF